MHELCTYHIDVRGQLDENAFNATSPIQVAVVRTGPAATQSTIRSDQSGLIGLIRHLHQQGFVLLAVYREE